MLLIKLFSITAVLITFSSAFGQTQDSVRKTLIKPIVPTSITPWPNPWPDPWPPGQWETFTLSAGSIFWINQCGESFHDNGNISSICECNQDSILHGKSVYWDYHGRISSVYMYRNGRAYKFKNYQDGKLNYVENYIYTKEGAQQKHGKRISYNDDQKTIETYHKGELHGSFSVYTNGKLTSLQQYVDGKSTSHKIWYESGELKSTIIYDITGRRESYEVFDKDGTLLKSEYTLDGKPINTWLDNDVSRKKKTIKEHENGVVSTIDNFDNGQLIGHQEFTKGVIAKTQRYFKSGVMYHQFVYDSNGIDGEQTSWNKEGTRTEHYVVKDDQFIGKGFYKHQESKMLILGPDKPNVLLPYIRWTVRNGDTIRMDYHRNSVSNRSMILVTNYYKKLSDGSNVRNGRWYIYDGNYISTVISYKDGVQHGRAVSYSKKDTPPFPEKIGHYDNGDLTGTWEYYEDSIKEMYTYNLGVRSGSYLKLKIDSSTPTVYTAQITGKEEIPWVHSNRSYDTLIVANYKNDTLNGEYLEFHENRNLKTSGNYINGLKTGMWYIYHENGEIQKEGEFREGVLKGKWYEWIPNKNGVLKRKKMA